MPEDVKKEGEPSTPEPVPYSRFKEKVDEVNTKEEELQTLKSQQTGSLTPEQQKEKQAKDFLKGLVREELEQEATAKKVAKTQEQKEFQSDVDEQLATNTDVNREDFLKFIEKDSTKYGISGVPQAMELYKDLGKIKDQTTEEVKENLSARPKLPKSKGGTDIISDYSGDKEKSYEQVTAEIIEEAEAQGRK